MRLTVVAVVVAITWVGGFAAQRASDSPNAGTLPADLQRYLGLSPSQVEKIDHLNQRFKEAASRTAATQPSQKPTSREGEVEFYRSVETTHQAIETSREQTRKAILEVLTPTQQKRLDALPKVGDHRLLEAARTAHLIPGPEVTPAKQPFGGTVPIFQGDTSSRPDAVSDRNRTEAGRRSPLPSPP
jgi:hypothetical protein